MDNIAYQLLVVIMVLLLRPVIEAALGADRE